MSIIGGCGAATSRGSASHAMGLTAGEMGSLDEALSAMLSNDHGYSSTLASVMPSSNSPMTGGIRSGDLFASQYSSLQGSFPGSAGPKSSNFHRAGGVQGSRPSAPSYRNAAETLPPQWSFAKDEKWVLDAKNEALEASLASAVNTFRPTVDNPPPPNLNPPPPGGLQRYHSAPSSFLQCLADFNDDAFSHVSGSPLGDISDASLLDSFFADSLEPINERGAQQMDTDKVEAASSTSLHDYEQFLVSQNTDFGRSSSSLSSSTQPPGKLAELRTLTRADHGHGGYSTPGTTSSPQ